MPRALRSWVQKGLERVGWGAAGLAVFLFCGWRLGILAANRAIDTEEGIGVGEALEYGFGRLLWRGTSLDSWGELNTSPLHYLIDKTWISLWGGQPHFHWDLYVFFRMLPGFYWCFAVCAVFFFVSWLLRERRFLPPAAWAIGAGAAVVLFAKTYALREAARDRPYALWMLLTILHLLVVAVFILRERTAVSRRWRWAFATLSVLLPFNTYASLPQVALTCGWLAVDHPLFRTREGRKFLIATGAVSLAVGLWYFWWVPLADPLFRNAPTPYFDYLGRVLWLSISPAANPTQAGYPVLWQDAGPLRAWAFIAPMLALSLVRERLPRFILFMTLGLSGVCLLTRYGLQSRGEGLLSPRYFLFLLPYAYALSLVAIAAPLYWMGRFSLPGARWAQQFLLLALLTAVAWDHYAMFRDDIFISETDIGRFKFRAEPRLNCPEDLGHFRSRDIKLLLDVEMIHTTCR